MKRSVHELSQWIWTLGLPLLGLGFSSPLQAQGLLSITRSVDYEDNTPLSFNVGTAVGYDSYKYKNDDLEDSKSGFVQATFGAHLGKNNGTTQWNGGIELSAIQYFESDSRDEDLYYNARALFNIRHQINRRLTLNNNFYVTYEIEPDYAAGVTTDRRNGQYVYGYNNASVAYAWTRRFSTTTGHTIDGVVYVDDDDVSNLEDRLKNTFSQQFIYSLSRRTSLVGEYRYAITQYDSSPMRYGGRNTASPDYTSHYALIGVNQAWSTRTQASVRVGAEFYESDRVSEAMPYAEGNLSHAISRRSSLNYYIQAGSDGSELGYYDSRYSIRTGLLYQYRFNRRFAVRTGVHYVHSEFEGNSNVDSLSNDEVNFSLGFNYNLWQNVSLDAGYNYTTVLSDNSYHEYDRHRVSVGINAAF